MIRLLCTDDERDKWLSLRHKYLTASECATILGKNPYSKKKDYIASKRLPNPGPPQKSRHFSLGSYFETPNREAFSHFTGIETIGFNGMYHNSIFPYLSATIDGFVNPDFDINKVDLHIFPDQEHAKSELIRFQNACKRLGETQPNCELKNSDSVKWFAQKEGKEGKLYYDRYTMKASEEPPYQYELQCNQQMMVTGKKVTLLLAKLGANAYTCYSIVRTSNFAKDVKKGHKLFFEEVVSKRS